MEYFVVTTPALHFARLSLAGALLCVLIYGFFIEPARLVVHHERIELADWPAELSGLRLVLIGDLHAGAPFIREAKLRRVVSEANAANPDVILLLGDYVTMAVLGGRRMPPEALTPILSGLRSRHGTFAVLGNHDGWFDRVRVQRSLEGAHVHVLHNESATFEAGGGRLTLYGLADLRTDEPDLTPIRSLPAPLIVMTHSPDVFPAIRTPVALTVAAHTHGGQVRLPLVGSMIVPSIYGQRYAAGHIVERGQHLYVTTGVGTSILPVRIGVVPQITVLELFRSPASPAARPSPPRSSRSTF